MRYRYVLHCQRMPREAVIEIEDLHDLLKTIHDYVTRYGPIDLLYNVARV